MVPLSAQISARIFSANFSPTSITSAPYSATQTTERVQTLADGSYITQPEEDETVMYRDSAGRTRIEVHSGGSRTAPDLVTISDPVAGFRYEIYSYNKVVERYAMPAPRPPTPAQPPPAGIVIPPDIVGLISTHPIMDGAVRGIGLAGNRFRTTSEFFGTQEIEGVAAQGRRVTTTLEPGAVGNDREIVVTDERWASMQLQVLVLTKMSDPRFGNTTRKLAAISLAEPDPALFVPPVDYTLKDMPAPPAP
jgi:hypothetical protein